MRQTLFYIPHEMLGVPIFGAGWALGAWLLFSVVMLVVLYRRNGWTSEARGYLPLMIVVAVALYGLLPRLEVGPPHGAPIGLAIRGYGVFVLLGIVAGVAITIRRVRQTGYDPDLIYSLAMWLFIISIASARAFYVIEYWHEFQGPTIWATLAAVLQFTQGGLVVYGAAIGGLVTLYWFSRRHKVSMLVIGDLIAPGMVIGLAFGRIGCLMNGCCYGGTCEEWPLAITFPRYASRELNTFSPPYAHQLATGELYGFGVGSDAHGKPIVKWVKNGSAAARHGLYVGAEIDLLDDVHVNNAEQAHEVLSRGRTKVEIITDDARTFSWNLPARSHPVQPTQIYSSINALLICLVTWFAYPFRKRDGQILALMLLLYSVTRFLLEWIRNDEIGQWGTALTISQLVSVLMFVACVITLIYLQRRPLISKPPA